MIFEYWSTSISNQQEYIWLYHNYYLQDSTTYELRYFGKSPFYTSNATTLFFGKREIAKSYADSFYVANTGNIDLVIQSINQSGDTAFKLNALLPLTIKAGKRAFIVCYFNPTERKNYTGSFTLYHNAPGDSTIISASGTGASNWIDSIIYLDTVVSSYNVTKTFNYFLNNTGEYALRIDSIKSLHNIFNLLSYSSQVQANDSGNVSLNFTPTNLDVLLDTQLVYHNHYRFNKTMVIIPYRASDAIGLLNPRIIDHGALKFGDTSKRDLTLHNVGEEDLFINFSLFKHGAQFKMKPDPRGKTLDAGDSIKFELAYTPSSIGEDYDTLYFITRSNTWKTENFVLLKGQLKTGKLKIEPNTIAVSERLGTALNATIKLRNIGNDSLIIDTVTTDNSLFQFSLPRHTLAAADSMDASIIYPNRVKASSDTLNYIITHSGATSPDTGTLFLTTTWPELEIADSLLFSTIEALTTNSDSFKVYNKGTDTLIISNLEWFANQEFNTKSTLPIKIPPKDSAQLILQFAPLKSGYRWDSLSIRNNTPDTNTLVRAAGTALSTASLKDKQETRAIALLQNFPNPFNTTTVVGFYLNKSTPCRLLLYNLHGVLVRELYSGNGNIGFTFIDLSKDELAAGNYKYVLEVEGNYLTKSMIIY